MACAVIKLNESVAPPYNPKISGAVSSKYVVPLKMILEPVW